jgi:hypothetical protein
MHSYKLLTGLAAGVSLAALATGAWAQASNIPGYDAAVAAAASSDWANAESERGGLHLIAQFDSSGPDAWSPADHPLIYITSESHFNPNPNKTIEGAFAGFHLIDANTKEVFADYIPVTMPKASGMRTGPHGTVISPDGKWAYVGWAEVDDSPTKMSGYLAVVNMRTLKIDKLMKQQSHFRGEQRSQRLHHIQACVTADGHQRVIAMWGFGADGGPHQILNPDDNNRVERAITYEDVQVMGHPFVTPDPSCTTAYVSIGSPELRGSEFAGAGIAKVNMDTGAVTNIMGVGHHPIGITHDVDGKFTYVVDGHGSHVYKIDDETNEIVGSQSAGVAGPYGIAMNWDESLIFTVGKGEGTHNRGSVLGVIDGNRFSSYRGLHQMPVFLGGSASSVDHAILHPDPKVNELWVSNMNGWDTIVLDLETLKPKAWIPTPHGGDTHSGAFVAYQPDWTGELMADQGGPVSERMREMIRQAKAASN